MKKKEETIYHSFAIYIHVMSRVERKIEKEHFYLLDVSSSFHAVSLVSINFTIYLDERGEGGGGLK